MKNIEYKIKYINIDLYIATDFIAY